MNQEEWTRLWQKALKVDYEQWCMCKSLRQINEKGTDSLQASAEETAKYEVKSADYMKKQISSVVNSFELFSFLSCSQKPKNCLLSHFKN
ncbi:protein rep [Levilactobacillus brevis]